MKAKQNSIIKNALRKKSWEAMTDEQKQLLNELEWDVLLDREDSTQGYITLSNPKTDRMLVISKSYGNQTGLYGPGRLVTWDLDTMDYINYMNTVEGPRPYSEHQRQYPVHEMIEAKRDMRWAKKWMSDAEKKYRKAKLEYEGTMQTQQKRYDEANEKRESLLAVVDRNS